MTVISIPRFEEYMKNVIKVGCKRSGEYEVTFSIYIGIIILMTLSVALIFDVL